MDEGNTLAPLTMFSFAEIVGEIELKRERARTGHESWDLLHEVASGLAGEAATSKAWQPTDRKWLLERVSIQNYRGVSNRDPLTLAFDPSPGITVLHGLNGAGKSSVSDAIELGLSGETSGAERGKAGKAALWEPIHLSRGSDSARIEVTLRCQGERLLLQADLGADDIVTSHTARLQTEQGEEEVTLGASWNEALKSYQPVFAYAALERRVQLSKDLASYFEGLLALGGSFEAIRETIEERGFLAREAHRRWDVARDEAMRSLAEVDAVRGRQSSQALLAPIERPSVGDNREAWLSQSGLLEKGLDSASLPRDTRKVLTEAATQVAASVSRFEQTAQASEQRLATVLDQLYQEATSREIDDDSCPVCLAPRADWLSTLEATVQTNRHMLELKAQVTADTKILATLAHGPLAEVFRVMSAASQDGADDRDCLTGRTLVERFHKSREDSVVSHSSLNAAEELSRWLCSEAAGVVVDEAVAQTDAAKQWRVARSRAVEVFVDVWKREGVLAAQSALWRETSSRVEDIRKDLRSKRSAALEGKAGINVQELLADAELELRSIDVKQTTAKMELVDGNQNPVELGMLSAGQRNAVLLAPLLASVDAGPFGFLILDDPVHAFDELRIDRLASSLSKLAETRRVIVLTHDDRLKENLAARTTGYDTRLVERSAPTGDVQVTDSGHFWHVLLDDAAVILSHAKQEKQPIRDVSQSIRGLCRMSIDNALRTFTLRNAALYDRDTDEDLRLLDEEMTTSQRLAAAASFWAGPTRENPVEKALSKCESYLGLWNPAVHGNPQETEASIDEIRAARQVCNWLEI